MKPVLGVSFEDPADVLRAYEMLRANFKCEFEFGSLYDIESHEPGDADQRPGWNLRNTAEAHGAFRLLTAEAREELLNLEQAGVVPTVRGLQHTRPNPNEYNVYNRLARELLVEDRPGEDVGKRLLALKVVGVFNDRLKAEGLTDLLITTAKTRKLYTALRASVPNIKIKSGVRTYVTGVDWSPEAYSAYDPPPFRPPYA